MPGRPELKKITLYRAMVLMAALTIMALFPASQARSEGAGKPVALVNGTAIYKEDLACAVEASMARKLFSQPGKAPSSKFAADRASRTDRTLNRLIEIELLYQESLKHRFPGLSKEAETRYKNEVRQLGGEKHLRSALSCNNMTPDQFRKAIFRNLSIKWFLDQEVYSRIVIRPGEAKSFYEENRSAFTVPESVRLRQIFIRGPKGKDEAKWRSANERALNISRAARDGANFVNLARKYSEDPSGANEGGNMGVVHKGNIHDPFSSVLFTLDDGAVTEPLKSRHGFHIFNIITRTPSTTKRFQDVQNEITTTLRKRHAQEMVGKLIEELRSKADIRIVGKD